uniref:Uncharacterized protein n=1 Tax=Solanum lycopersicum TaxID=4081 RepID=A0A3Q7IF53_SOLLC
MRKYNSEQKILGFVVDFFDYCSCEKFFFRGNVGHLIFIVPESLSGKAVWANLRSVWTG